MEGDGYNLQEHDSQEGGSDQPNGWDSKRTAPPILSRGNTADRKRLQLKWDEENLVRNAEYAAAHPRMKIDEPKTPFVEGSAIPEDDPSSSDERVCRKGSHEFLREQSIQQGVDADEALQTRPSRVRIDGIQEISEATLKHPLLDSFTIDADGHRVPSMIENSKLQGFSEAESDYQSSKREHKNSSGNSSSTPRSREEFEKKRKQHYHREFVRVPNPMEGLEDEDDNEGNDDMNNGNTEGPENNRHNAGGSGSGSSQGRIYSLNS